jgi:methionyl-tRNA formyltransferase
MRVVKELDAGSMFAKATRPIGPDETSDVVEEALADIGAALLIRVLDQIVEGTAHEEPQDDASATYAPRLTKEEGLIDWSTPSLEIHNRVRGLYPWPHAYTFLHGHRLIVRRTHLDVSARKAPPYTAGGTVVRVDANAIHVATGDGEIAVVEIQPEGRRAMPVHDFILGHPIAAGDVFSPS